ncbi:Crp/Fnr family transcriptional regulator [Massilia sp. CF038]|uniref:Crp/Fnr family transcriptional regulator n=1 Tax=Massilia sp. CF038 TaxID=1881045 RepID=UPI00090FF40C|nr:Crp/Fnr family transcriptional regulator [Massilia sp. CF038]SHG48948.1 cAMP-binding domain of CRP or a regulatory subunit of cAMP-dependent protein kinases [Massilia sp. CF038]
MVDTDALLDGLSRNGWFGALPLDVREQMIAGAELVRLRPGEMLFRQGDAPSGLYGLVSGTLKMSSLREDGREAILAVLEQGIWFGEISLIDDQPRTHDATAVGQVEVLVLQRAAFDLLMERAVFARAVAQLMAGRIRLLYGIVEDATLRSTRARIARRLLLLARGDITLSPLKRPRVPVSQEGLAMMLGISRQTLSKELRLLSDQGAIVLGYGYIEVVSEAGLGKLTLA